MNQIPVVIPNQEWGIDPNYLTPAYMANFRPAYKKKLTDEARKISETKGARRR